MDNERLWRAVEFVDRHPLRNEDEAERVVAGLCREGATYQVINGAHQLRFGGIVATCTYGRIGLLQGWKRVALRRLDQEMAQ